MARKRKPDAKEAALAQTRTLNPRPEAVRDDQFASAEFFDARDLVQVLSSGGQCIGWIRVAARQPQKMGLARWSR